MISLEQVSPESLGVPSACVKRMIDRLEKKEVPMHSFIFYYKGKIMSEGYYAPYTKDSLHRMFSITKSLTAIAIGFLQEEGKLSITDSIASYFPEYITENTHPWILEMTIQDMLMMRTCHASTTYKVDMKSDWVESFFTVKPTHKPGTVFHYDTSSAHTLCALVEKLTGMELLDYLKKKLAVLDLSKDSYALKDPFGVTIGGSGLVCTSRDILKIGIFLLQEGNMEGTQYLSKAYCRQATSLLTATKVTAPLPSEACGYGYQIWQNETGGFVLYGMGGQLVIVLPEYDFILVTTADTQGMAGGNQLLYDALYEEVLPYLVKKGQEAKPIADTKEWEALSAQLKELSLKPLSQKKYPVEDSKINALKQRMQDRIFRFEENAMGFSSLCFHMEEESGELQLTGKDQTYHVSFGLGCMKTGMFPKYEQFYASSGVFLDENTLYLRFSIIDSYVGSVHMQFYFGEEDVTVFFKKVEESLFQEFNGHFYAKL